MSDNNSVKRYELDQHARFDGASDHAAMALSGNGDWVSFQDYKEQSDRIEELQAKLAKAVEALKKIETGLPVGSSLFDGKNPLWRDAYRDLQRIARITLAELKGEDRG
jgi:hypothetical protein